MMETEKIKISDLENLEDLQELSDESLATINGGAESHVSIGIDAFDISNVYIAVAPSGYGF
jgi:hypothetical protein